MNDPTQDITAVIDVPAPGDTSPEGVRIRERLARMDGERERLFRINSGSGFVGRIVKRGGGGIVLADARVLRAAPTGWPDLCGWESVTITPEMVGTVIARFLGEEFKGAHDKLRPEQARLAECLIRMGGIHRIVRP